MTPYAKARGICTWSRPSDARLKYWAANLVSWDLCQTRSTSITLITWLKIIIIHNFKRFLALKIK